MAGFLALRTEANGDYDGKLATFAVDAAHARRMAPGDCVIITGDADSNGKAEADNFADGAIATKITGVVAAIEPQFVGENLSTTGLAASTAGKIHVHISPQTLFEVDSDATLASTAVGSNVGFNAVESTLSGGLTVSNYTLDSSSVGTAATLPFQIVALAEDNAGVLGNKAIVRINDTTVAPGAVGV